MSAAVAMRLLKSHSSVHLDTMIATSYKKYLACRGCYDGVLSTLAVLRGSLIFRGHKSGMICDVSSCGYEVVEVS